MKELCLKNGLKMYLLPMMNTHSVTVGLYVRAGARYESKEKRGITHLLEHLHFRELDGMTQDELYYAMESIGSTLRATTYYDFFKFTMKIRPCYLAKCIDIFTRIISSYTWSESGFEQEKSVVKKQIEERGYDDSGESVIRRSLFGDDGLAYGIMGSLETVDAISVSDVTALKKNVFNNRNMALCVTGNIGESDIELLKERFGELDIREGERLKPSSKIKKLYNRKPDIVFSDDVWNYLDVDIAFDVDYREISIDELRVLNCILGEGVGSRLQKCVREEMSYTSDIYSEPEIYEDMAVLHIKFSVSKRELLPCLERIFNVIAQMKQEICESDMAVALPFFSENLEFLLDDTERMNFEAAYNNFVLGQSELKTALSNTEECRERLMKAAKKVFVPKNTGVIICGSCGRITKKSIREIINSVFD